MGPVFVDNTAGIEKIVIEAGGQMAATSIQASALVRHFQRKTNMFRFINL